MMTRKDYVQTADILNTLIASVSDENLQDVYNAMDAFSEMFAKDNERFNKYIFERACGVTTN